MNQTKQFKVAEIGQRPNHDGLFQHLLVAPDGECWTVSRRKFGPEPTPWTVNQIIEVPVVEECGEVVPVWAELKCEVPTKTPPVRPFQVVERVWGLDIATRNNVPFHVKSRFRLVKPSYIFKPSEFPAVSDEMANQKADFCNRFALFLENGFREIHFDKRLFDELGGLFGLPFDGTRHEFFSQHFSTAKKRLAFITHIVHHGCGVRSRADEERILRAWIFRSVYHKVIKTYSTWQAMQERALLDQLLFRYGVPDWLKLPR